MQELPETEEPTATRDLPDLEELPSPKAKSQKAGSRGPRQSPSDFLASFHAPKGRPLR